MFDSKRNPFRINFTSPPMRLFPPLSLSLPPSFLILVDATRFDFSHGNGRKKNSPLHAIVPDSYRCLLVNRVRDRVARQKKKKKRKRIALQLPRFLVPRENKEKAEAWEKASRSAIRLCCEINNREIKVGHGFTDMADDIFRAGIRSILLRFRIEITVK